jgi:hypothetical protein
LDGEVDINAFAASSNFETITERRKSTMGPATATILRNVLVEGFCHVGDIVVESPREVGGERCCVDVRMRKRRIEVVLDSVAR